jgi:hypothetical protein
MIDTTWLVIVAVIIAYGLLLYLFFSGKVTRFFTSSSNESDTTKKSNALKSKLLSTILLIAICITPYIALFWSLFFNDTIAKFVASCNVGNVRMSPDERYGVMKCKPPWWLFSTLGNPTFVKVLDKTQQVIYQSRMYDAGGRVEWKQVHSNILMVSDDNKTIFLLINRNGEFIEAFED